MPQLLVRKIEENIVEKLRRKAMQDGISVEEEHRRILRTALSGGVYGCKQSLKELLRSMPDPGEDFPPQRDYPRESGF